MRTSQKLTLIAVCAAALTAFSAPAYASEGTPPPAPSAEQIQSEIDSITDPATRAAASSLYEELVSQGREVLAIQGDQYVPANDAARSAASVQSLPADCNIVVAISKSNLTMFNDAQTSCSTMFGQVNHHMRLTGQNPYPPGNFNEVANNTYTTYNAYTAHNTQAFTCNNSNATHWYATAEGTLARGSSLYTAPGVQDRMTWVSCGW